MNKYTVRVGSSIRGSGGVQYRVKNQYTHDKYNPGTIDFDFALLELEKPVTVTKDVNIVKLVDAGVELKPGTVLTVTGWGSTGVSILINYHILYKLIVVNFILIRQTDQ